MTTSNRQWVVDPDDPRAPPQDLYDRMTEEQREQVYAVPEPSPCLAPCRRERAHSPGELPVDVPGTGTGSGTMASDDVMEK